MNPHLRFMLAAFLAIATSYSNLVKLEPPPQQDLLHALLQERLHGPPPPPPPPPVPDLPPGML